MRRQEIARKFDEIVDVRGRRAVHRHAGEALLERHVRAPRLRRRRAPRARDPPRRRGARRRRRRVPAALPRPDAGPRRDGPHDRLRLAQHADDHAALRSQHPARRGLGRARRPQLRRRRALPRGARRRGRGAGWPDSRTRPATTSCACARSASWITTGALAEVVDVRRPRRDRDRPSRVLRRGEPITPKIKLVDGQGQVAFNAIDTDPRWLEPPAPGDYVVTAWIPSNLLNEGLVNVGVVRRQARDGQVPSPRRRPRRASRSTCRTPEKATPRAASSSGSWQGAVRPLLEWTVDER